MAEGDGFLETEIRFGLELWELERVVREAREHALEVGLESPSKTGLLSFVAEGCFDEVSKHYRSM